jgi:antitoxin ParD1/3/4
MCRATSLILGEHFDKLIKQQIKSGRYNTAREVVRDALRLFEQHQDAIRRLNSAVEEGFESEFTDYLDWDSLEQRAENAKHDKRN